MSELEQFFCPNEHCKDYGVRATARLLELDKDTVNRLILRAGEHCAFVLSGLLTLLQLTEVQLDELWTFIKKRKVLAVPKTSNASRADVDLDGY